MSTWCGMPVEPVLTIAEVAEMLGISSHRVWQLEQSAFRKLRRLRATRQLAKEMEIEVRK